MKEFVQKFMRDERGLAAVEYAVVAGVLVIGLITVFGLLGGAAEERITDLITELDNN
jgi:pilus assembly protein Flp/PilA